MTIVRSALLVFVCIVTIGCSSKPPPPPAMTDDLKAAIKDEDAKVRAAESQQSTGK
jgi:hypothetical protein